MARPRHGGIYNVADDEACPAGDPVHFAAYPVGIPPPDPIAYDSSALSPMARSFYAGCKRLDTTRIRSELVVTLTDPTYREGLAALGGPLEEQGAASPTSTLPPSWSTSTSPRPTSTVS